MPHKKMGDMHLALAQIFNTFIGIDGWFTVRVTGDPSNPSDPTSKTRMILEFGRYVNGTLLRQNYEAAIDEPALLDYPLLGYAVFEIKEQFETYCAQWAIEHPVEVPIVQAG
jgi:hypothetical protein